MNVMKRHHLFRLVRLLALAGICQLIVGCTNFLQLRTELIDAKENLYKASGVISFPGCASQCDTVLLVVGSDAEQRIQNVQVYDGVGPFAIQIMRNSKLIFAFHDKNQNFQFDAGEPYATLSVDSTYSCPDLSNINLVIEDAPKTAPPDQLGNLFDQGSGWMDRFKIQIGSPATLSDERFNDENATLGMWQPLTFMRKGFAGVYFLEPYTPEKIPVLFVHGINGSPRNFKSLIDSLDRKKYQPWVVYYPSSVRIRTIGNELYTLLNLLHAQYHFSQMHVVAHSMGGLISRDYLNQCFAHDGCEYLRSFTSISSPFWGHASATQGLKYAPVPMPVWKHLDPNSVFLAELFTKPLPHDIPHYLAFGYRNTSLTTFSSSDGVITLESQLRPEAQRQAKEINGYNEDHMTILENKLLHAYIQTNMDKASSR